MTVRFIGRSRRTGLPALRAGVATLVGALIGLTLTASPAMAADPHLEMMKGHYLAEDSNSNGYIDAGDGVGFWFYIANVGSDPLTDVTLSDPMLAGLTITCYPSDQPFDLDVAEAAYCYSDPYPITDADVAAGSIVNTATASATAPDGPTQAEVSYTVNLLKSGLELTKSVTSVEDVNNNGLTDAGDIIHYGFSIKNIGQLPVSNVVVDDPLLTELLCFGGGGGGDNRVMPLSLSNPVPIGPGATGTCQGDYTITADDVTEGSVNNTASVTGTDSTGDPVADGPVSTSTDTDAPAIQLTKEAGEFIDTNGSGKLDAGDEIPYTFEITNTGDVTLTSVTVQDSLLATAGVSVSCTPNELAPGESVVCTASGGYVISQDELNFGNVDNTATAYGVASPSVTVSSESSLSTPLPAEPGISLAKTAYPFDGGDGHLVAGDSIFYEFLITNTGNVTLTNVTLTDPMLAGAGPVPITCAVDPITVLYPGDAVSCRSDGYAITSADADNGEVVNVATVTGTPPAGDPVSDESGTTTEVETDAPSITLDKTVDEDLWEDLNGNGLVDAGDIVHYSLLVTNSGNVTLTDVVVSDPMIDPISCRVNGGGGGNNRQLPRGASEALMLAPGQSGTCTGSYVISEEDMDFATLKNQATVTGTPPGGNPPVTVQDDAEQDLDHPAIGLVKHVVSVTDSDGNGFYDVGDQITYEFTVTNTGDVDLTNIAIVDDMVNSADCDDTSLAVGESTHCEGTTKYTITDADAALGKVVNVATATGTAGINEPVVSAPASTETPVGTPGITLDKESISADWDGDGVVAPGDPIYYSFTITNTGTVTLTDVHLTDSLLDLAGVTISCGSGSNPIPVMAPGEVVYCWVDTPYTVTDEDGAAQTVKNVATVTGNTPGGDTVSDKDETENPAEKADPSITLNKTVSSWIDKNGNGLVDAGDEIVYLLNVVNTGNVTLTEVTINDPMLAAIKCGGGGGNNRVAPMSASTPVTLSPGGSMSCSGSYVITTTDMDEETLINVATVTGNPPTGDPVGDLDDAKQDLDHPAIGIDKRVTSVTDVNGNGFNDEGDLINYEFTVTNTGDVDLVNIAVTDDKIGSAVSCVVTDLAVGESTECLGDVPWTISAADVVAGKVVNVATASGTAGINVPVQSGPDSTDTPVMAPTPEPTDTASPEPTDTASPEPTDTASPEPTDTASPEPTDTASPEPTDTASPEPTDTASPEPTDTASPEPTDTASPEPTDTASPEPTDTASPEPTDTASPEPSETASPEPTDTASPEPSETASPEPSETASPEPSETASPEPSETASPEPSETASPEPSETASPEPSETANPEPSETANPEPSETPSPEPSETASPEPSEPPGPTPGSTGTNPAPTPGGGGTQKIPDSDGAYSELPDTGGAPLPVIGLGLLVAFAGAGAVLVGRRGTH